MRSIRYPRELPISARAADIVAALRSPRRRVLIVSGETGCGKSTQIPKMCLEAGRGRDGRIGVTQPRRLAAVTIADRIAQELGEEGRALVGSKIRFQDRTSRATRIKVMTDGILLAETQGDRRLREYDTIIIDEAHERSLNIDFLLGIMRRLLDERPELKVVITSATLDTEKFSQAFGNAPVIEVSGRHYPVEVEYRPPERDEAADGDYVGQAVEAVAYLRREKPPGDVLVFMPTEQDILETCRLLGGKKWPGVRILPLFARLPAREQRLVYSVAEPKIVVATNVAETSLTIPGIRYVVDTGLARIARYQPGTRINTLPIAPISRASADQRKGRCGRVREGLCVRLYSEEDYESRDEFTAPEILRSDLAEVILRMTDLGLGDPLEFPFLDRPSAKAVRDGYDTLVELGAIKSKWQLTERGRLMARIPLDPRLSRMLIEACAERCLPEAVVIAAALSVRDPRERPPDKAAQADAAHAAFRHPDSDLLTLLNIWNRTHEEFEKLGTLAQKRRFCHDHFLSFQRMREWTLLEAEIRDHMAHAAGASGVSGAPRRAGAPRATSGASGTREEKEGQGKRARDLVPAPHKDISPALYGAIHRSILSGFLSNIAVHKEKRAYTGAKGRELLLWPGSAAFAKPPAWIVSTEVVRTSRLFARTVARIDPDWLERLGGPLCKRSYSDAAWDRSRGEVTAKERVTLFGLEIVRDRRVSYSRIDPIEAHRIFVMSALVEGEVDDPPPFLVHNLALQRKVRDMEEKLRRRDILVPEARIAELYSARLPGIADIRSLRKLLKDRGGDDAFLRFAEDELLSSRPEEEAVASFPDSVEVAGRPFQALYKFAPGEEDDGVTLTVPAGLLPAIPPTRLEWGVPGQYREKIEALIKGLPKRYRKLLVPVGEKAETIAREMPRAPEETPLVKAVSDFVRRRFGVDIPAREWALAEVPRHLRMRVAVVDPATGRVIDAGRDVELLRKKLGAADEAPSKVESPAWQEARRAWERSGIERWDFGDLPESVAVGASLTAYPALEVEGEGGGTGSEARGAGEIMAPGEPRVRIHLFPSRAEAEASHRRAVRALLMRKFGKELAFVRRYHRIPAEYERPALFFGGREALERAIEGALVRELFERPIRKQAEYEAYEAELGRSLFEKGHLLTQTALKIVAATAALRSELAKGRGEGTRAEGKAVARGVPGTAPAPPRARSLDRRVLDPADLGRLKDEGKAAPEYVDAIAADLDRLVPKDFLEAYPLERLLRLPAYLEGLRLRLERARIDPEKDRAKAAQVEPYALELRRLEAAPARSMGRGREGEVGREVAGSGEGGGQSEAERRQAVEELRWMIEEFKLSLFAPEVRTAFPISAVRLARKIREIESSS